MFDRATCRGFIRGFCSTFNCSVMPFPVAAIPAIVSAVGGLASTISSNVAARRENRSARLEYRKMLDYNAPKNQMQRFREGGLSPYLMYGQGNAGNAASPAPANVSPRYDHKGMGLEEYMSAASFMEDIKAKRLQNGILANRQTSSFWQTFSDMAKSQRTSLELLSDFPGFNPSDQTGAGRFKPEMWETSFRRKLNELKVSLSMAGLDKMRSAIAGMSSENIVKGVRAKYASDYGMVGGDWTQGLGLLKSLPSFFKSRAKSVSAPAPKFRTLQKFNP